MAIIIGETSASGSKELTDYVFWKIQSNGTMEPWHLPASVLQINDNELQSQLKNPDFNILEIRYDGFEAEPMFNLREWPWFYEVPVAGTTERDVLLKYTPSAFASDYPTPESAAQEIYNIYNNAGITDDLFVVGPKPEPFMCRSTDTSKGFGTALLTTRGTVRNGQPFESDNVTLYRWEIYIGNNLDAPIAYIGRVEGIGGNPTIPNNLVFGTGELGIATVVDPADENQVRSLVNPTGFINEDGFTISVFGLSSWLIAQGIIPAGTAVDLSIIMTATYSPTQTRAYPFYLENI